MTCQNEQTRKKREVRLKKGREKRICEQLISGLRNSGSSTAFTRLSKASSSAFPFAQRPLLTSFAKYSQSHRPARQ